MDLNNKKIDYNLKYFDKKCNYFTSLITEAFIVSISFKP